MIDIGRDTILLVIGGSRAYGMHRPESDVDIRGILCPPQDFFFTTNKFEQTDSQNDITKMIKHLNDDEKYVVSQTKLDGVIFSLIKFVTLAAESNPNIWDILFCRDEEIRYITPVGKKLRDNASLFISAKARYSFAGYAHSQLKRIKGHREWLMNPPSKKPVRADYGLPENTLIPADQLVAIEAATEKQLKSWNLNLSGLSNADIQAVESNISSFLTDIQVALGYNSEDEMKYIAAAKHLNVSDNLIHVMLQERQYKAAATYYNQYESWKKTRNPARAAMEAKSGFDCKHASHLVRLFKMCKEVLLTGNVNVWRGVGGANDADHLISIRNGEISYDELIKWAAEQDKELDDIYKNKKYVVPDSVDMDAINSLLISLIKGKD